MTCIVAVEHEGSVWIGGDSAAIDDSRDFCLTATPKVFTRGPMVIGCSGGFRAMQALRYSMAIPNHGAWQADEEWICTDFVDAARSAVRNSGVMASKEGAERIDDGFAFILGYRGLAYVVEPDFGVVRSNRGFETIGCGAKYALGSLHGSRGASPDVRIRLALEAAEAFNAGVKAPFAILQGGGTA